MEKNRNVPKCNAKSASVNNIRKTSTATKLSFGAYYNRSLNYGTNYAITGQTIVKKVEYKSSTKRVMTEKKAKKDDGKEQQTKEKERIAKLKREYKADLSKAKRAKYSSQSLSAQQVLKDLKNSASRSLTSVKCSLENLSQKLGIKSTEGHHRSIFDKECSNYCELENEPRTPVKLYSPFTIETPSPTKSDTHRVFNRRRKIKPSFSIHSEIMSSPTGKIKDDIRSVTNSLNELSMISDDIRYRFSITTSCSNFSITTQ